MYEEEEKLGGEAEYKVDGDQLLLLWVLRSMAKQPLFNVMAQYRSVA